MKGVSAIIAIILILMIVVALSALAYTWFSGIFTSLTTTTSNATSQATTAMAMQFRIEAAKSYGGGGGTGSVNATIRNIGTVNFDVGKLGIYIDGMLSSYVPIASYALPPGQVITLNITNATAACPNKVLAITLESGLQDSRTISC
jgi:archaellum component FlaF (FlaF/FlaG flagellin family)